MAAVLRPMISRRMVAWGLLLCLGACQWLPFAMWDAPEELLEAAPLAPQARPSVLPAHSSYERIAKALGDSYPVSDDPQQTLQAALAANHRLHEALSLYLQAEAARARAHITQAALAKMPQGRLLDIEVRQTRARLQADLAQDEGIARSAADKLNAMAGSQIAGPAGVTALPAPLPDYAPLESLSDPARAAVHHARLQRLRRDLVLLERQQTAQAPVVARMSAHLGKKAQEALASDHESLANVERNLVTTRFAAHQIRLDIAKALGLLAKGEKR